MSNMTERYDNIQLHVAGMPLDNHHQKKIPVANRHPLQAAQNFRGPGLGMLPASDDKTARRAKRSRDSADQDSVSRKRLQLDYTSGCLPHHNNMADDHFRSPSQQVRGPVQYQQRSPLQQGLVYPATPLFGHDILAFDQYPYQNPYYTAPAAMVDRHPQPTHLAGSSIISPEDDRSASSRSSNHYSVRGAAPPNPYSQHVDQPFPGAALNNGHSQDYKALSAYEQGLIAASRALRTQPPTLAPAWGHMENHGSSARGTRFGMGMDSVDDNDDNDYMDEELQIFSSSRAGSAQRGVTSHRSMDPRLSAVPRTPFASNGSPVNLTRSSGNMPSSVRRRVAHAPPMRQPTRLGYSHYQSEGPESAYQSKPPDGAEGRTNNNRSQWSPVSLGDADPDRDDLRRKAEFTQDAHVRGEQFLKGDAFVKKKKASDRAVEKARQDAIEAERMQNKRTKAEQSLREKQQARDNAAAAREKQRIAAAQEKGKAAYMAQMAVEKRKMTATALALFHARFRGYTEHSVAPEASQASDIDRDTDGDDSIDDYSEASLVDSDPDGLFVSETLPAVQRAQKLKTPPQSEQSMTPHTSGEERNTVNKEVKPRTLLQKDTQAVTGIDMSNVKISSTPRKTIVPEAAQKLAESGSQALVPKTPTPKSPPRRTPARRVSGAKTPTVQKKIRKQLSEPKAKQGDPSRRFGSSMSSYRPERPGQTQRKTDTQHSEKAVENRTPGSRDVSLAQKTPQRGSGTLKPSPGIFNNRNLSKSNHLSSPAHSLAVIKHRNANLAAPPNKSRRPFMIDEDIKDSPLAEPEAVTINPLLVDFSSAATDSRETNSLDVSAVEGVSSMLVPYPPGSPVDSLFGEPMEDDYISIDTAPKTTDKLPFVIDGCFEDWSPGRDEIFEAEGQAKPSKISISAISAPAKICSGESQGNNGHDRPPEILQPSTPKPGPESQACQSGRRDTYQTNTPSAVYGQPSMASIDDSQHPIENTVFQPANSGQLRLPPVSDFVAFLPRPAISSQKKLSPVKSRALMPQLDSRPEDSPITVDRNHRKAELRDKIDIVRADRSFNFSQAALQTKVETDDESSSNESIEDPDEGDLARIMSRARAKKAAKKAALKNSYASPEDIHNDVTMVPLEAISGTPINRSLTGSPHPTITQPETVLSEEDEVDAGDSKPPDLDVPNKVNVYTVIRQMDHSDPSVTTEYEATVLREIFLSRDKANEYARRELHACSARAKVPTTIKEEYQEGRYVGRITEEGKELRTHFFVKLALKTPAEIPDFNIQRVQLLHHNSFWMAIVVLITKPVFDTKLGYAVCERREQCLDMQHYSHMVMANHAACKALLEFITPPPNRDVARAIVWAGLHEDWGLNLRNHRDVADAKGLCLEVEIEEDLKDGLPWLAKKYKAIEVKVVRGEHTLAPN